jgi:CRISPR-associated endonuclease/helicase Cas3
MNHVHPFHQFFQKSFGTNHAPEDYQVRLATDPLASRLINIPTGLGKTAAVIHAWLWNRIQNRREDWPRRLVYCLPMRTLVEQTNASTQEWLEAHGLLWDGGMETHQGKVGLHMLMGGESTTQWDLHPEADAILIGTQDMLLSRALNRGYGMSRFRWPMHYGLLNNDCLWVFDEVQLMGAGLPTTAQIEAFRANFGSAKPCHSWWMSATNAPAWFNTVDFDPASLASPVQLEEPHSQRVTRIREAPKAVARCQHSSADVKRLCNEILNTARDRGGLTRGIAGRWCLARVDHPSHRHG